MNSEKRECLETKAEKFQRLVLGILLFTAYVFQFIPIVIFVALVMIMRSLFSIRYTPFFQLYIKVINPISKIPFIECSTSTFDRKASKFACDLGFILLAIGMLFFYLGKGSIAWILILIVGTLSILAGTIGFCLGTAIYVLLFKVKEKQC